MSDMPLFQSPETVLILRYGAHLNEIPDMISHRIEIVAKSSGDLCLAARLFPDNIKNNLLFWSEMAGNLRSGRIVEAVDPMGYRYHDLLLHKPFEVISQSPFRHLQSFHNTAEMGSGILVYEFDYCASVLVQRFSVHFHPSV